MSKSSMAAGGGKILGLLASVCFLLISRLPVLHEQLTTTLRSAASAECLEHDSQKAFSFACQGQDVQVRNPPAESTDVTEQGLFIFFSGMFEFQFIPLAVFKVVIDSVKFTEQENKNTTRFLSFLQHEMKWDVVFFFFFVR